MKPSDFSLLLYFCFCPGSFAQITLNPVPTRAVGQDSIQIRNLNPNLVEGREFDTPEGIALDLSTNPPALYVSDSCKQSSAWFQERNQFRQWSARRPRARPARPRHHPSRGTADIRSHNGFQPRAVLRSMRKGMSTCSMPETTASCDFRSLSRRRAARLRRSCDRPAIVFDERRQPGRYFRSHARIDHHLRHCPAALQAFITFDASGNLWVADAGNNRVLRFNANVLGSQASPGPAADIVLGQTDFVTGTLQPAGLESADILDLIHYSHRHCIRYRRPAVCQPNRSPLAGAGF